MSDLDFKAASHDGYGDDWPISYEEMVPYYEKVERYVGISGMAEGLPQLPDSIFLPPMEMTCSELAVRKAIKDKFGRTLTIGRVAILTKAHNGRAACHYCGPCERGCVTNSYFSSPFTTIKDAQATGRLTLITDAVAARVSDAGWEGHGHRICRCGQQADARGEGEDRDAVRFDSRIDAADDELGDWQFERRAWEVSDGSHLSGRS